MTRNRSTIIVPAGSAADEGWAAFRSILVEIYEASQLLVPPAPSSGPLQVLNTLLSYLSAIIIFHVFCGLFFPCHFSLR